MEPEPREESVERPGVRGKRTFDSERPTEEAAVGQTEVETDPRETESQDQSEALPGRHGDELPVGAGEDPDEACPTS